MKNADTLETDNGIETVDTNGAVIVSPSTATTYTVIATGPKGSTTDTATLTILPASSFIE